MAFLKLYQSPGYHYTDKVDIQARGRYMIPAFKVLLYGSFGASMYMMGRLTLVGILYIATTGTSANQSSGTQDLVLKHLVERIS